MTKLLFLLFGLSIRFGRSVEAELVAAGWPAWLSAVAGEAIHGWLPLKSESFERLEKIGQGTYSYGTYVDMWSVGCVFAELFVGRPILKGRTEVEQLHKIFKLCGTPADDYWTNSRFPLAPMFRPQSTYQSSLRERCKELPTTAVDLIDALLSVEPEKRATAKSALQAEYFHTRPYACDPASMPKYPPNKELDARFREQAQRRKKGGGGGRRKARNGRKGLQMILEEGRGGAHIHRSRESLDSEGDSSIRTLPAPSNGRRLMYDADANTRRGLQRHQSFMKLEALDSSSSLSDHKEEEKFQHKSRRESGYGYGVGRSRFSREL